MRQHIDTIPLWEAYQADCECPLCHIEEHNEAMYVESFLGGSVMEPSTRVEVNAKGFCGEHFRQLLGGGNKLGVALMAHTHLKEIMEDVISYAAPGEKKGTSRFSLFSSKEVAEAKEPTFTCRCILCDRLNNTMDRYVYTLFHMWKTDKEFKKAFEASRGFCLPHFSRVVREARENLSASETPEFLESLRKIQRESLERLEKEVEWFTLKFDYRNSDKPWGNSQDAVERVLLKLRGYKAGEDITDPRKKQAP